MRGRIINNSNRLESKEIVEGDFLSSFSLEFHMMDVPAIQLVLPITYSKYITGSSIIRLIADDWVYEGYIEDKNNSYRDNIVTVRTSHIVGKLAKRSLPTNVTVKDKNAKETVEQAIGYWGKEEFKKDIVNQFTIDFIDKGFEKEKIEYEFSNESLLDFFTKVCSKTTNLYWRINRYHPYLIEFGEFGTKKNILINEYNYMIELSDVTEDYSAITNAGVVMSDKSDSGASSLTLRDIFYNKSLMVKGFPVIKTDNSVNTQRQYDYPQIPIFAPEIIGDEFAVLDEDGIALEAGELYWNTITDNDTQAVAKNNKEVTDEDRLNATKQLYQSAIRKLKNSRRRIIYTLTISPLPDRSCQLGDKVMFTLNHGVTELTACTNYYEKVLKESNWFYITRLTDKYGEGNTRVQEIELSKFIYSDTDKYANS